MIPQDLLDILVCPVCKKPLVLKDEGQTLKCGECRRVYPIRDKSQSCWSTKLSPSHPESHIVSSHLVPQRHNVSFPR